MRKGRLYVVAGPSGVGKGTVLRKMMEQVPGIFLSISLATRDPRPGEQDGVDYYFITESEFRQKIAEKAFLEHAEYSHAYYGTLKAPVDEHLSAGMDVVLEIDVQGAMQVRAKNPDVAMVFIAPPSLEELARRLRGRGTESEEKVQERLEAARRELEAQPQFDYVIVNDIVENAVEQLKQIFLENRG